jgi:hypothetical protein
MALFPPNLNRAVVREVIHDDLLGELQVVISKPRRARPPATPVLADDAPADTVAAPAHRPTGPPPAPKMAIRVTGRRHV